MKTCSKCEQDKPLELFNRNANTRDGRRSECRECTRKYGQLYKARNLAKWRRSRRRAGAKIRATAHGRAQQYQKMRVYRNRHPERVTAMWRAQRIRPVLLGVCSDCGDRIKTHRHLLNFDNPPKTIEICRTCCMRRRGIVIVED